MDWPKIILPVALIGIYLLNRKEMQTDEKFNTTENPEPVPPVVLESRDELVPAFCQLAFAEDARTANFSLREFHSKDGISVPKSIRGNIQLLMEQLEVIRASFGRPMIVTSGWRSPIHNKNVGGVDNSYHLCGMASDIIVPGIPNDQVQERIIQLMAEGKIIKGGLGRYNTFTHYDIGPGRMWDKRG